MTEPLPAFAALSGPHDARILIVGEAWGEHEAATHRPFVGESGKELWRMLGEAWPDVAPEAHAAASALHRYGPVAWVQKREEWLAAARLAYTNVFALRPPGNKLDELCGPKREMPEGYAWPHVSQGKYVRPEFLPEVARLDAEITAMQPNLIIAVGNAACWALLRETNIGSIRGTIRQSREIGGRQYKVIPVYHPAAVMRQWAWRPIVVADLMKAWREAASPEITRPARRVLVSPTLPEITEWIDELLAAPPPLVACDTETSRGQITMLGFAASRDNALLIPFIDGNRSYWAEAWEEEAAIAQIARVLESPDLVKVFQNGLYDFQYILKWGLRLRSCTEDTMLLHHSILPEMKKGLGFLGSVYTSEPAWKLMRLQKADTEKRDE